MPRRSSLTGFIGAIVAVAAACGGGTEPAEPASQAPVFKPIDPSQVAGIFSQPGASRWTGVLPCADCAGIRTELMLLQDPASGEPQTYELEETYLGSMSSDGEKAVTSRGKWSIAKGTPEDPGATVYRLDGDNAAAARRFEKVSEQELRQIDRDGRRIASDLNYVLTRVPDVPVLSFPAPPSAPPPTQAGATAPGESDPAAMVTDLAAGWPINLRIGQRMTARLTADRAAGAQWSLRTGLEGGVVASDGVAAYEAIPGGGGIEVFRFKAVKSGSTTLTFELKKPGDAAASRQVSYPVTVQ